MSIEPIKKINYYNIHQINFFLRVNIGLFDKDDLNFYYEPKDIKRHWDSLEETIEIDKDYNKENIIIQLLKPYENREYKILFSCNNYSEKFKIIRYLLFLDKIQPLNRYFLNNYDFEYDFNDENDDFNEYNIQYNLSCIYGTNFWFFDSTNVFQKICQEILDKMPDCRHYYDEQTRQYPVYFIDKYCYKCIEEKGKILNLNEYLSFLFPLLWDCFKCPPEIVKMIIDFISPSDMVSNDIKDLIYDSRISRIKYNY